LKDPIAKWKLVTIVVSRPNDNKLCGKEIEISYVDVAMQEVFELDTIIPYAEVTIDKCHTYTKNLEGVVILWSSKFMKVVSDAPTHNVNVAWLLCLLGCFWWYKCPSYSFGLCN
jgi:hypothetical protein